MADRLLKFVSLITAAQLYQPVILTLRSRISNSRFLLIGNLLTLLFLALVFSVMMVSMGLLRLDSYRYFPDQPAAAGFDPDHYASLRSSSSKRTVPWIQSDLIERPLVRLFLPFRARSGNELIAENCPEVEPFHDDGLRLAGRRDRAPEPAEQVDRARECLFSLYQLNLNDKPLSDLDPLFSSDPHSGIRGLTVAITGDVLLPGKNQLRLDIRWRTQEDDDERPKIRTFYIPFWYLPENQP